MKNFFVMAILMLSISEASNASAELIQGKEYDHALVQIKYDEMRMCTFEQKVYTKGSIIRTSANKVIVCEPNRNPAVSGDATARWYIVK